MAAGLASLGVALITALWGVARFVFGAGTALQLVLPVVVAMVVVWIGLPLTLRLGSNPVDRAPGVGQQRHSPSTKRQNG